MGGFPRADRGQLIYDPKMSDPIYFVVLKGPKGIYATKYHDQIAERQIS
jgi:hypothetical protein